MRGERKPGVWFKVRIERRRDSIKTQEGESVKKKSTSKDKFVGESEHKTRAAYSYTGYWVV